ncbi:Hypothetical protein PHPALM_10679 [Phytophthora palmivora]|uniref:Reverse transcriptase domain-containing protein n=2 Tax=Phytophthora palmivora TaxID=4796 RepID=A0A2P4Y427_9STRA|nr:Hypothetical protein PHPALM_10679 [Phytophthora palmivora]
MPPYVTDISHPALVKWKRERQEYEDAIEARCAATGEDKSKALRSVKNSFNRNLLNTLCKFEWGTTIEDVTEDRIRSELDNIIRNVMNDDIVDVDALFDQRLKMDLREADVKARVINYFMLCDDIILQHGLSSMFSTPNGIKEKCKFLKQYLEPVALRDAVDTHHRLVDSSSKTDEQALYQLVKDKALEQEKVFRLLAKRKQHPGEGSGKSRRESNKGQRSGVNQGKNARVVRNDTGEHRNVVSTPKAEQKSATNIKSKPRTGCFHCGKDHWLSQCPDLDEAAKEALLSERKAKKGSESNMSKRYRSKRLEQTSAVTNDDEDELLVGKALLSELGIDIEQQLEYLASRGTDEDDPFEEPDGMPPCRPSVGDVVMNVVDALVQDAIDRGVVDDYIASRLYEVYSPSKSAFLEKFNKRLIELGWVYENLTEPIAGVMPSLEVALEHCKGKMFYAMFDFLKGFWQLPLAKCSQEFLSYMTDKGIFTPTRVPQGSTDAALHFQSTVEMVLGDLVNKCVIVWIDDLLVFANTQEELVGAIDVVLTKLDEHGLILNPKKSTVFLKEVRWCGRIINQHGVGHDPERIQALREMPSPTTAAELQ